MLIVYYASDARGRPLLRATDLTDLDVQTACALEVYGRGEVTRRARLRASQGPGRRGGQVACQACQDVRLGACPVSPVPVPSPSPPPSSATYKALVEYDRPTGLEIEDDTASIVNDDDDDGNELGEEYDLLSTESADQRVL